MDLPGSEPVSPQWEAAINSLNHGTAADVGWSYTSSPTCTVTPCVRTKLLYYENAGNKLVRNACAFVLTQT